MYKTDVYQAYTRPDSSCRGATSSNNVYWSVNTPLGISDAVSVDVATRERPRISRGGTRGTSNRPTFDQSTDAKRERERFLLLLISSAFFYREKKFSISHFRHDRGGADPDARCYWAWSVSGVTRESSRPGLETSREEIVEKFFIRTRYLAPRVVQSEERIEMIRGKQVKKA